MRQKFTTATGDPVEMHDLTDDKVVLNLNSCGSPVATLNVDELEVLRDIFDAFAKAKRAAQKDG